MSRARYNIIHQGVLYFAIFVFIYGSPFSHWSCTFHVCRTVLRRLQTVSGLYGMVAVPDKTSLLHPVVGRLRTGATVRVVQPAEVIHKLPWTLEDNKSCGLRMTYDLQRGKSLGTLTVRVCWCTIIFRDEIGFAAEHFVY